MGQPVNVFTKYGTLLVIGIQIWLYFAIPQRTKGAMEALITYRLEQAEQRLNDGQRKREELTRRVDGHDVLMANTQLVMTNIWITVQGIRSDLADHIRRQ
jgi:hypothetical protein